MDHLRFSTYHVVQRLWKSVQWILRYFVSERKCLVLIVKKEEIKADRPLTRDTLNAPDYWQTDNSNGLVMVICNYHWLNSASRVLTSTCFAPLVQTGEQFFTVWPWTLTYDLDLQSQASDWSEGQSRPSCQKSRSKVKRFKQESAHRQTDGHTDATKRIIAPATRSIINASKIYPSGLK